MSSYYDSLDRNSRNAERVRCEKGPRAIVAKTQWLSSLSRKDLGEAELSRTRTSLLELSIPERSGGVPAPQDPPGGLAAQPAIRQLCERIAPRAVVGRSCRVAVAGCRSGDGASSLALAFAIDLSQRLSVRTILVDGNLRAPNLERVLFPGTRQTSEISVECSYELRATPYSRLTLATVYADSDGLVRDLTIAELEAALDSFPAVVIDLGVARLDSRILPLVRPTDPIMLVIRYGYTQRKELETTTAALRSADRTVAGVILNAKPSHFHTYSGEQPVNE